MFGYTSRGSSLGPIATLVLGLLLLLAPGGVITGLLRLIGWAILIGGVVMIVLAVTGGGLQQNLFQSLSGLVTLLLGLWMVRNPGDLVAIAITVVGILMLLHAINDLGYARNARMVGAMGWWSAALSGGVTLVLSLLMLLNPFGTALSVLRFAGVCLLIDGIGDLFMNRKMGY